MPHSVDIHVGKQLRLRRTVMGFTQENIGNAIGVTFQQVQKYERGTNRMGSSRLFDFARYLTVPVSYFFEGLEPRHLQYKVAEEIPLLENERTFSRETLEMVRAFQKIENPVIRKQILSLIQSIGNNETIIGL